MSEDLDSRACARANARADRSALAAAGNRADDGAKGRAAAHLLGSVSAARLPGHIIITGDNRMQFLVDQDIGQFELQLRLPRDMAGLLSLCQAAVDVGALRRDDGISYREVLFQTGAEFVSDPVLLRVHGINHAHEYSRPCRDRDALRAVSAFARGRPHPRCGRVAPAGLSISGERQCHDLVDGILLQFPIHLKADERLRAAEIFAFDQPAIFHLQRVG